METFYSHLQGYTDMPELQRITEGADFFLTRCSGSGCVYIKTNNKCYNYNREKDDCTDLFTCLPAFCIPSLLHATPGFFSF